MGHTYSELRELELVESIFRLNEEHSMTFIVRRDLKLGSQLLERLIVLIHHFFEVVGIHEDASIAAADFVVILVVILVVKERGEGGSPLNVPRIR